MKTKVSLGIFLIVAGLAIIVYALVGKRTVTEPEPKLREMKVRLKWVHQAQFAGFYAASRNGYYLDEKLAVKLEPGGQDMNALRLVASGSDDLGVWGAEQLIIARSQGIKVTAIGAIYQDTAACFVAKKDSGIAHFKDFVGHTVGVQRGTDLDTIYTALLSLNQVSRNSLKEIPVSYNLPLFFQGDVDVWPSYITNEPYLIEKRGIPVSIISPKDNGLRFYGDTLFCRDDFRKQNEDALKAFMRATVKGWRWALEHPEEAAKLCLSYDSTLDLNHQIHMLKTSQPLIEPPGQKMMEMTDERWLEIKRTLQSEKLLDADVPVSTVYSNEYLQN